MTFGKELADDVSASLFELITHAGLGRDPVTATLDLYTTAAGLLGILESGSLYATHAELFNDTSEYENGLRG